jgi:hypothetical protein
MMPIFIYMMWYDEIAVNVLLFVSDDAEIENLSITEVFLNYNNDDYASADKFK